MKKLLQSRLCDSMEAYSLDQKFDPQSDILIPGTFLMYELLSSLSASDFGIVSNKHFFLAQNLNYISFDSFWCIEFQVL